MSTNYSGVFNSFIGWGVSTLLLWLFNRHNRSSSDTSQKASNNRFSIGTRTNDFSLLVHTNDDLIDRTNNIVMKEERDELRRRLVAVDAME